MGRKEGRIKAEDGAVAELARQLRLLRAGAGSPTYRSMASRTHYAATTLSRAASGGALPSLDVVLAFAQACGGDAGEWRRRWEQANAALNHQRDAAGVSSAKPVETGQPVLSWLPRDRRAGTAVLLVAAIGVIMILVASRAPQAHPKKASSLPVTSRSSDGDDPRTDGCAAAATAQATALGAREVAVRAIVSPNGGVIGWLGLWRNTRCGAEWAEASYVNPHLYPVTLESHRPADDATVIDHAVVNLPRDPVIGKLLTTGHGCIWARMILQIPNAKPVVAQTPCR